MYVILIVPLLTTNHYISPMRADRTDMYDYLFKIVLAGGNVFFI